MKLVPERNCKILCLFLNLIGFANLAYADKNINASPYLIDNVMEYDALDFSDVESR